MEKLNRKISKKIIFLDKNHNNFIKQFIRRSTVMETLKSISLIKIADSVYVRASDIVSVQIMEGCEGYYAGINLYSTGETVRTDMFDKKEDLLRRLDLQPVLVDKNKDAEIDETVKFMQAEKIKESTPVKSKEIKKEDKSYEDTDKEFRKLILENNPSFFESITLFIIDIAETITDHLKFHLLNHKYKKELKKAVSLKKTNEINKKDKEKLCVS